MYLVKMKKRILPVSICLILGLISFAHVKAVYLPTNRDTKLPPDAVTYDIADKEGFEPLYETDILAYYFREDRDIFLIEDKRNGYTWKTGLDIPFGADINEQVMNAKDAEEAERLAVPLEDAMNTTYTAIANSLITVEYDEGGTIKQISSASREMVESRLLTLNGNPATRLLDVDFRNIDLQVKVGITLGENGITYEIKDENITGSGKSVLIAIDITPFLGASGGRLKYYNPETQMYDITEDKYMVPGYILVPDGCGSLIRFQNNNVSFTMYYGDVYGKDHTQDTYYTDRLTDAIPLKDPVMPVFGVAHGNGQAAFVAYADSAAEYMQICVRPEENLTAYTYVYPRFVYNTTYFQVYNNKGDGYFTLMSEPNRMDIRITYEFLAGDGSDGSPAADYTGMALTYRKHLIEQGILTEKFIGGRTNDIPDIASSSKKDTDTASDIPIRLDFLMSDSKKGIVGTEEVVVTTVEDVRNILTTLMEQYGIKNINSGLYGWQKGGESLAKPYSMTFSGKVGKERAFKELFLEFAQRNVDISYARDFAYINKEMLNYNGNAARHVNTWYLSLDKSVVLPKNSPVLYYSYAKPEKSASWFTKLFRKVYGYSKSVTVEGMTKILLSSYTGDGLELSVTDVIKLYQDTFENADSNVKLNMENPNMYLWKYTDRYLSSPVGTSQYVFETDAVPFLQMVLNGTMEVYAPYSNFSFYTQKDILRMIDYNVYPSFILTKEPSHLLASTPSADLYSTEFSNYEMLIADVYRQVNEALSQVAGLRWVGRTVLDNGVIKNTYEYEGTAAWIIINYTDETYEYNGLAVAPQSARVIKMKDTVTDDNGTVWQATMNEAGAKSIINCVNESAGPKGGTGE